MPYYNLRHAVRKSIRLGLLRSQGRAEHVLVACFPKSGSTYMARMISELTGYKRIDFVQPAAPQNEQDIYDIALNEAASVNTVTQQHVKGSERNLMLIKQYGLKPIVLTRNIYDVVVSAKDHIQNEDHRSPMVYVPRQYQEMSLDDKYMFLIRNMIPWYFSFLNSWLEAAEQIDVFWTSYEAFFGDQVAVMSEIADFAGFQTDAASIEATRERMKSIKTRKNVGKSGRGEALSDAHVAALNDIARSWHLPPEALARIGITL